MCFCRNQFTRCDQPTSSCHQAKRDGVMALLIAALWKSGSLEPRSELLLGFASFSPPVSQALKGESFHAERGHEWPLFHVILQPVISSGADDGTIRVVQKPAGGCR